MSERIMVWIKIWVKQPLLLAAAFMFGLLFVYSPPVQANEGLLHSPTLTIGPYTAVMQLSNDPPQIETPLQVTLLLREKGHFSGQLIAQPGQGTNAVPVHTNLAPDQQAPNILRGSIYLPVRGAWHLLINLNGPQGPGTASTDLTVSAPNAMPAWLGWLIGLSPLLGSAWFARQQWRYRRKLLIEKGPGY